MHPEQVVRERIKELIDFATSESPYRDANKGWLNDDVYLQLGSAPEQSPKTGVEMANVSVFWNPINQIASILLAVVLLASVFVFLAVSLAHGKFDLSAFRATESIEQVDVFDTQVELKRSNELDIDVETVPVMALPASVPISEREVEPAITTNPQADFAAAALGGNKK